MKDLIRKNNDTFVVSLLEKYNPFGLTWGEGRSMFFQQQVEAYLYIMVQSWVMAPRGYIELPLLIRKLYVHLSYRDCIRVAKALRQYELDMLTVVENWAGRRAKRFFEQLCNGLCSLTNASYSSQMVDSAWQLFLQRMEIEKLRKEQEDKGER